MRAVGFRPGTSRGTHDPWKPNDAVGFKAVLVRQLCTLYDVIGRMVYPSEQEFVVLDTIRNFIFINFRSQMERNSNRSTHGIFRRKE